MHSRWRKIYPPCFDQKVENAGAKYTFVNLEACLCRIGAEKSEQAAALNSDKCLQVIHAGEVGQLSQLCGSDDELYPNLEEFEGLRSRLINSCVFRMCHPAAWPSIVSAERLRGFLIFLALLVIAHQPAQYDASKGDESADDGGP